MSSLLAKIAVGRGSTANSFSAGLAASYELDFWGLNQDKLRQARESLRAARYAETVVGLTTTANVANEYFTVLAYRERITIKVAEANKIVQDYTKSDPKLLGYVDITATLLGPDGHPDPALYEADGLHLNEDGYKRYAVPIKARVLSLK